MCHTEVSEKNTWNSLTKINKQQETLQTKSETVGSNDLARPSTRTVVAFYFLPYCSCVTNLIEFMEVVTRLIAHSVYLVFLDLIRFLIRLLCKVRAHDMVLFHCPSR